MKNRVLQSLHTKEKLTNAFWMLYEKKPYDQITVREITELAGCNRSTFYTYFKDVYDVLERTEDEIYKLLQDEFDRSRYICSQEEITESIRFIGEFLKKNHKRLVLLLGENGDVKFAHRILQQIRERMRSRLSEALNMDDTTFEYVVEYIMNAHVGLTMRWFQNGCDISFEKMAELIYRLTTGGLISLLNNNDEALKHLGLLFKNEGKDATP
ncbi:MAG TPA: TetR/AcrR family transcriptional regulator C-terminal domain-containing protein [Clostridia bacterium]|nr:TetR/AcrR family transcriptional regulator C-terminal domain-containing protein [Clostridia bacterium]